MKRIKGIILLGGLTMLALSGIASASAFAAAPEFKVATGTFPVKFTGKSGAVTLTGGNQVLTCSAGTSKGEVTGAKTVGGVAMTFTGCSFKTGNGSSCKVSSAGAPSGTIETYALEGAIGKTSLGSRAGLLLKGAEKGSFLAWGSETCGRGLVTNEVFGEIASIGKSQLTNELIYAEEAKGDGLQKLYQFEGETAENELKREGTHNALASADALTFERAVEIT